MRGVKVAQMLDIPTTAGPARGVWNHTAFTFCDGFISELFSVFYRGKFVYF